MSFPQRLRDTFLASEINFLAENELVDVLPKTSMDSLPLIGTNLPKLRINQKVSIPIWLAIILKKQNKINLIPPNWLSINYLKQKYEEELKNKDKFSEMPWFWLEFSKMFLIHFKDDLIDPSYSIRSIIQDLREIRLIKIRSGFKELNESNLTFNNLSLMEINEIRPFAIKVMDQLRKLNHSIESSYQSQNNDHDNDNDNENDNENGYQNDYGYEYDDDYNIDIDMNK
ncbi:DNA replication protein PSF2 [Ascoidea rubescens DSM 1968]|uniref:DNA replication complex GINS protein PSF2 n=1 Tax=Ascoidea rubescens DSM 1968 TaxID=1344418 RepID=A0A1D2V898_9ASCO|nr:GINS complex, PSF2 component [Ascoidea rubescens DSM 1968]ODV57859.1 GINS complex, PSF2 component [Ascoidea rubescens DSM 1968]